MTRAETTASEARRAPPRRSARCLPSFSLETCVAGVTLLLRSRAAHSYDGRRVIPAVGAAAPVAAAGNRGVPGDEGRRAATSPGRPERHRHTSTRPSARIAVVALQILLTNDDGIDAPGIAVLRRAVEGLGDVTTIAPDRNTSAVARGITIHRALCARAARPSATAGTGSPATAPRPTACASRCSASSAPCPTSSSPASTPGATWAPTSRTPAPSAPPSRRRSAATRRSPSRWKSASRAGWTRPSRCSGRWSST